MTSATATSAIVSADAQLATTSGLLTGLALVFFTACVYFHVKKFTYWSSRGVPGPLPWPVFGTTVYYLLEDKLVVDTKWRQRYGKTFGLYEGYSPMLRTTDNEVIKQIYVKKFNSFTDRHNEFIYDKVARNWLLWSEGARWANQRALVSPMFSSAKMRQMLTSMTTCVERFLDQARNSSSLRGNQQKVVTLEKKDLSNMTLDVIATTFFGLKLDTYGMKKNEFFTKALEFSRLSLTRFLSWMLIPRHIARALAYDLFPSDRFHYFDSLTKRIIEERRRSPAGKQVGQNKDFVQMFLDARLPETYESVFDKDDDRVAHYNDQIKHEQLEQVQREQTQQATLFKRFSDLEIRGQMTFMFVAGFETTSTTLGFCIYELAHQPNTQRRLLDELEAALGQDEFEALRSATPAGEDFYSKLINLQLLDAFVSETLRLYTPLVEHNRRATEPVELTITTREGEERALALPKGLPISTQGFVLQRDPEMFDSPGEHKLERFLPENRDKIKTCSFVPFGVGPRHCAGMRFALLEIKLALVKLLASFELAPGPKSRVYPPKFQRNPVFLLLEHSDFQLTPRAVPTTA